MFICGTMVQLLPSRETDTVLFSFGEAAIAVTQISREVILPYIA
jgi:hypothetical protein